ncbi:hypothetical protein H4Q26_001029 [Puccinia striiformis f. sp. tritici PST-130]|nr:hypothetical protein H4Q26_001029 [Puccinia striiformis f. sp. tritici PST-130]
MGSLILSHDDQDEEEREAVQDIALVPLADLLNAKTGSENYNTYGDPPNADLLRRYGHVDVNRYDVVEISIKTCLECFEIPTELERKSNGDPLPEELTYFEDHKSKEKLPKPKLNSSEVIILAQKVIERRMKEYPTSIEEDESLLARLGSTDDHRKIKAIIVRNPRKNLGPTSGFFGS